jgi:hypothetical protein
MALETENPQPGAASGLSKPVVLGSIDGLDNTQKAEVKQARTELLREEIVATVSPLIGTLEAALAMAAIPDDAGLLYALRTAKAYWRCASANAAELIEIRETSR